MRRRATVMMLSLVFAVASVNAWSETPTRPPAQAQPPAPAKAPAPPPTTQPQPPATIKTPPPAPSPQRPATAGPQAAARASVTLTVTDPLGAALSGVRVTLDGAVTREGSTGRDGVLKLDGLRAGTYRLRFEAAEFNTLEREITVKAGAPVGADVTLNRGRARPADAQAPSAPPPAGRTATAPPGPTAEVEVQALPDWIERNLVGRSDPRKETTIGRTAGATATIVQVRDPIKDRMREDADEMIYVIAGQGALVTQGHEQLLDAGSFAIVPRGVSYTLERRGRNPLVALSVVGR